MIGASPIGAFPVGARAFLYSVDDGPTPAVATVAASTDSSGTLKLIYEWSADDDGVVQLTTGFPVDGRLVAVQWVPDGDEPPTAGYGAQLLDSSGHDVLLGQGAARSASASEYALKGVLGAVANSALTLSITGAGDGGAGTLTVWVA